MKTWKVKLIVKIEPLTDYNLRIKDVSLKHHPNNSNSKSLRSSTHAHL